MGGRSVDHSNSPVCLDRLILVDVLQFVGSGNFWLVFGGPAGSPRVEVEELTIGVVPVEVPLSEDARRVLRLGNTRVSLDIVVNCFLAGQSPEEIAEQYPTLELADLHVVLAYYLRHTAVVDKYLAAQAADADRARARWQARVLPKGIRERLLSRRSA